MKIKKLLFIFVLCFGWILGVDAATLELKTDGKTIIKEGENLSLLVNLKEISDDVDIQKIEFDLDYNSEILSVKIVPENQFGYSQLANKDNIFVNKANKSFENGSIITLTVTALPITGEEDLSASVGIKNLKIDDSLIEDEIRPVNLSIKKQVTTTTRAKSTSAELTGFKVNNNATIKPAFSKDVKEYKIYVKDTIQQITITPSYEQNPVYMEVECTLGCSTLNPLNKLKLVVGKNEATFNFTSEDEKDKKTYKFIIYRGPTTDGSNLLQDLSIKDIELKEKFNKDVLDYTATVPYNVETITVEATPEDENADVSIKGNEKLVVGENVITITVTSAETMEKKIYNLTVTREEFVPEDDTNTVVTPKIEKDEPKEGANNTKLLIIIAGVSTLIIAVAAYFIFFYKGKKKNNDLELPKKAKSNKLLNELVDEDKEPTSVDDALKDLMKTKEISEVESDEYDHL